MDTLPVLHNVNPGYVSGLDNILREIGLNAPNEPRYEQAMAAFAIVARDKNNAEYIIDKLVSAFFFEIQARRNRSIRRQVPLELIKAGHPGDWPEHLDVAYFLPRDICKALPKLNNIAPELQAALSAAAKTVFQKLSVENLTTLLLSADTPAWLGKVILCNKRFLDLLSGAVNITVDIEKTLYDDTARNDDQKAAEICKTLEQIEKAIEWLNKCPPQYLPVNIDPYPPELLYHARMRARQLTQGLPLDKLLALSTLNVFPAWLRQAAENRFQELTASAVANNPGRPKRRRRRKTADVQPPEINESENL
jgi:hypothetical protein